MSPHPTPAVGDQVILHGHYQCVSGEFTVARVGRRYFYIVPERIGRRTEVQVALRDWRTTEAIQPKQVYTPAEWDARVHRNTLIYELRERGWEHSTYGGRPEPSTALMERLLAVLKEAEDA